jgi:hypothetical protein
MRITSKRTTRILLTIVLADCSSPAPHPSRFEREFQQYVSLPPHKVFVIAGDPEGEFVYGYGYKFLSVIQAQDRAMEQCNIRKRTLRAPTECVVYAVDNEVVWQGFPTGAPKPSTADRP